MLSHVRRQCGDGIELSNFMKTRAIYSIYVLLVLFQNYIRLHGLKAGLIVIEFPNVIRSANLTLATLAFIRLPVESAFACFYALVWPRCLCESKLGQLECFVVRFWPSSDTKPSALWRGSSDLACVRIVG